MSAFEYVALDTAGRTKQGVVSAPNERAARQALQSRNLAPVKLTLAVGAGAVAKSGAGGGKLSARQLTLFTRQLATLVAVTPLEEALRTIAVQAEQPKVRRILLAVHAGVLEGYRLSDAMTRQKGAFPGLYCAMVAAGESSGALPAILERLADLQEKEQQVRGKVVTALVYPSMLAVTATLVIISLMTFVVPRVVEQFDTVGQKLPFLTRAVIAVSEAFQAAGLPALGALALGGVAFSQALRQPAFRVRVDRFVLRLPVIGRLTRDLHAAQLGRTLATMIAGGLPVLEGLTITARTVRNLVLRRATEQMAAAIREGGSLSAAMRKSGVMPPILMAMAASGESSGRLDIMLERAADYLEREFNTFTAVTLSLLEPAIIVLMGGLVALIVLSILLPILQINTLALG